MIDIFYIVIIAILSLIIAVMAFQWLANFNTQRKAEKKWSNLSTPSEKIITSNVTEASIQETKIEQPKKTNVSTIKPKEETLTKVEPKPVIKPKAEPVQVKPNLKEETPKPIPTVKTEKKESKEEQKVNTSKPSLHSTFAISSATKRITYAQLKDFFKEKNRDKMLNFKDLKTYFYQTDGLNSNVIFAICPYEKNDFYLMQDSDTLNGIRLYLTNSKTILENFNLLYDLMKNFKEVFPEFEISIIRDGTLKDNEGKVLQRDPSLFTEQDAKIFVNNLKKMI